VRSQPKARVNPHALQLRRGYETVGLRSKSWDEFAKTGAPRFDFVFTVCDNAAAGVCAVWPGQPLTAHWGQLREIGLMEGAKEASERT